jgi:hypothetical protein
VLLGGGCCAGLGGCQVWDDVRSREFTVKGMFVKPDPLVELRDSKDGDHRARAMRRLKEPLENGGNQKDQDLVVTILVTAGSRESQALCRLAAVQTLATFKDPRALEGIKNGYYKANDFAPETATMLKCAALAALGESKNPAGVETLVAALREPAVEGTEEERQFKMDERIAAARALGHFKNYQATEALVQVLRKEKDVALRDRAHESLEEATGKDFPPDAQVWADFLHNPQNQNPPTEDSFGKKVLDTIVPTSLRK